MLASLDTIDRHIAASAWSSALVAAVRAWRTVPHADLAELIDALDARVTSLDEPPHGAGPWRDRAAQLALRRATGEPDDDLGILETGALLATMRAPGADPPGFIPDRTPAVAAFHAALYTENAYGIAGHADARLLYAIRFASAPDPRLADAIVAWCERVALSWPRAYGALGNTQPLRDQIDRIASAFAATVDVRLRDRLGALANRPSGRSNATRTAQRTIAAAGLAALADTPPPHLTAAERARVALALAACGGPIARRAPHAPPSPRSYAPDALWLEVAAAPEDDGPRLVLADALLEDNDPRGELIVAQIRNRARRIGSAVAREWQAWMGPELGLVVMRRSCVFHRGMLDRITIGPGSVPSWVYAATHGHRELLVVTTVRLSRVHPPDYAAFVDALPNVRDVGVDSIAIATAIVAGAPRALAQIQRIAIPVQAATDLRPVVAPIAAAAPALREVALVWQRPFELAALAAEFPHLAFAVALGLRTPAPIPPELRALPNVRIAP